MRQRIMIGLALVMNPDILIADEPTTSLDVIVEAGFTDLLAALRKLYKLSIVLITHNLGLVAEIADRIAVMYGGKIMELAATQDIFARPMHPYTQGLINCVPNIRLEQKDLVTMPGSPPDLVDPPVGCRFSPRCPKAMPICRERPPAYLEQAPGHHAACWLYGEGVGWPSLSRPATSSRSSRCGGRSSISSRRRASACTPWTVSFEIAEGEVLGLAGESGSGKSTTGRLLLRLLEPTSGRIEYRGRDITSFGAREMEGLRARAQIVFQDPNSSLSPRMSVGQAISHPLQIHRIGTPAEQRERVLDLMEKVGLSPAQFLYRKYPHQLSGGQSQRVVLARALVTAPDFLVADEPIAMADVSVRALILQLMRRLKDEMGLTYLFITHDLATAKYLCDRIAVLYLGRIVELASRDDLFGRPHHPYTKALLQAVPVPDPTARRRRTFPRGKSPAPSIHRQAAISTPAAASPCRDAGKPDPR